MQLLLAVVLVSVGIVALPGPLRRALLSGLRALTIPVELVRTAVNPRLRANHALEHATINVIEERCGPSRLTGVAYPDGFVIRGISDGRVVEAAARLALARLQRGERGLALHARCGTSAATAGFLVAVVFLAVMLNLGLVSPLAVVAAMLVAYALGPPLGRLVQRLLTISVPGPAARVVGAYAIRQRWPLVIWLLSRGSTAYFVKTELALR